MICQVITVLLSNIFCSSVLLENVWQVVKNCLTIYLLKRFEFFFKGKSWYDLLFKKWYIALTKVKFYVYVSEWTELWRIHFWNNSPLNLSLPISTVQRTWLFRITVTFRGVGSIGLSTALDEIRGMETFRNLHFSAFDNSDVWGNCFENCHIYPFRGT